MTRSLRSRARRSATGATGWWRPRPALSPMPCLGDLRRSQACALPCTSRTHRSPQPSTTSVSPSSARAVVEALLALGGNVGDVRATLDRAIAQLCDGADVRLVARSSDYRTPPWGVKEQPPFVNLCIAIATTLSPRALLARAQDVERALGRDRAHEQRWGPRPVDIDLLAYGDLTLTSVEL